MPYLLSKACASYKGWVTIISATVERCFCLSICQEMKKTMENSLWEQAIKFPAAGAVTRDKSENYYWTISATISRVVCCLNLSYNISPKIILLSFNFDVTFSVLKVCNIIYSIYIRNWNSKDNKNLNFI